MGRLEHTEYAIKFIRGEGEPTLYKSYSSYSEALIAFQVAREKLDCTLQLLSITEEIIKEA